MIGAECGGRHFNCSFNKAVMKSAFAEHLLTIPLRSDAHSSHTLIAVHEELRVNAKRWPKYKNLKLCFSSVKWKQQKNGKI